MHKQERLRKILLREAFRSGSAVLGAAALCVGVILLNQSFENKKQTLSAQVQQNMSAITSLQGQLVKAKESLALYERILRMENDGRLAVNREAGQKLLDTLKQKFRLTQLQASMSPLVEHKDAKQPANIAEVLASDVTLEYEGLTDEDIFSFANAIKLQFPGFVRMESFTATKKGSLTRELVAEIIKGSTPALAKGTLRFKWFGVKYADLQKKSTPPAANFPPPSPVVSPDADSANGGASR